MKQIPAAPAPQPINAVEPPAPALSIIALPAERFPSGRLAIADCTDDLPTHAREAGHPAVALMAQTDPKADPDDASSYAALVINGVPQIFDTLEQAAARQRFINHARKQGAMLTFAGLERLVQQMKEQGVPPTAAVCVPMFSDRQTMMLFRLGGAQHVRLQAQHFLDGNAVDTLELRNMVIFDAGVFPPALAGVEAQPEAVLAAQGESGSVAAPCPPPPSLP